MNARILATCCVTVLGLTAGPTLASSTWWQPYSSDANTLGLWHFDDVTGPTGTFGDSGPGANDGTLSDIGGITLTAPVTSGAGTGSGAGMFGKSLNFSPNTTPLPTQDEYLNWGTVPDDNADMEHEIETGTQQMTIEAWIRPSAPDIAAGETYFFGKRDGPTSWNVGLVGGRLFLEARFSTNVYGYSLAPTQLTADTWQHVAAVYIENEGGGSEDRVHLYVNGTEVSGTTNSNVDGYITANDGPLVFGNRGTSTAYSIFQGQLDEVRYSNIAREFGPAVLPGDYNIDGFVDDEDYDTWRAAFGSVASPVGSGADGNFNGVIDAADYVLWRKLNPAGSGSASALAVPEPSTVILLQIVGLLCCVFRNSPRSRRPW